MDKKENINGKTLMKKLYVLGASAVTLIYMVVSETIKNPQNLPAEDLVNQPETLDKISELVATGDKSALISLLIASALSVIIMNKAKTANTDDDEKAD